MFRPLLLVLFDGQSHRGLSFEDQGPRGSSLAIPPAAVLTRQRDFSGDLDGRAADQRAASRSQNVRLVDFASGRGGRGGDGGGRAGGRGAWYYRRGRGDVARTVGRRCRHDRRGGRLPVDDLTLGYVVTIVANCDFLRDLGLDAETREGSGARRA